MQIILSVGVIYKAIYKWNASTIEFHLDLDGKGEEFDSGHCWLPNQIKEVINEIKSTINLMVMGKNCHA